MCAGPVDTLYYHKILVSQTDVYTLLLFIAALNTEVRTSYLGELRSPLKHYSI